MLRAREVEFYTALAALRDSQRFSVVEFAKFVDRIRESVSGGGLACYVLSYVAETCSLKSVQTTKQS